MPRDSVPAIALASMLAWPALITPAALARPTGPRVLCEALPESAFCAGDRPACTLCHSSPSPPVGWNALGGSLLARLGGRPFNDGLASALDAIGDEDADGDGVSNSLELMQGTLPADPTSVWRAPEPPPGALDSSRAFGLWDAEFALRRASVAFCGISPTYEQIQELRGAPDRRALVHAALDECLESAAWRDEILPRLADRRIQPLGGAGACVSYYANFEADYNLFAYVLRGDRDARDLLRAQYHVVRATDRSLVPFVPSGDDPRLPAPARRGESLRVCFDRYGRPTREAGGVIPALAYVGGQPTQPHERAGMITTQWFLWFHTMGAYLPRQSAAQAYRAWLGWDISQYEGLFPIDGEPLDVDDKGVGAPGCATCHSTLDPLAYAFAHYWGGAGDPAAYVERGLPPIFPGQYHHERPVQGRFAAAYADAWPAATPRIFGEALPADRASRPSLVEWAARASESDAFARNLAEMFFEHAVGRAPGPDDRAELEAAWRALASDGYSADRLLHRIVDTRAFGAP